MILKVSEMFRNWNFLTCLKGENNLVLVWRRSDDAFI